MYEQKQLADFINNFDPSKRVRILRTYYESLTQYIDEACQAADAEDYDQLRSKSHDIKGLAYMINAADLGKMAEKIEMSSMEGRSSEALSCVPDMKEMTGKVVVVLKEYENQVL